MERVLANRRIVVAVTGGIAAYKAAEVVSRLRKAGAEVRVAMTESATQFIGALTLESLSGYPVYQGVFEPPKAWEMEHISWARWAEALVVAPATANSLAKLALGLADDAVTTLALAFEGPIWVAPAMNTSMYRHPATQGHLATLKGRGVRVIEPGAGLLACGEVGPGRMSEPVDIVTQVMAELGGMGAAAPRSRPGGLAGLQTAHPAHASQTLAGKTVLITTGPTREALDPIRFISNRSTGQMGCELAAEALARGARVLLVHGPLQAAIPAGAEGRAVDSARQMLGAVQELWGEVDVAIFAAAVANYESGGQAEKKIKGAETLTLELRRTPDVAAWAGANRRPGQLLAGFSAESENALETAKKKLEAKGLDAICANPIGRPGVGFASAENQVTLVCKDGRQWESPRAGKRTVAAWIWDRLGACPMAGEETREGAAEGAGRGDG